MKKAKTKSGFSLGEALMTLLLISIVAFLSAPFLAKKADKKIEISHGIWECSLSGSAHMETKRNRDGTITSGPKNVGGSCTFVPPLNSRDFQIDICGGAPYTECRDEDGTHTYMYYNSLPTVKNVVINSTTASFGKFAFAYRKSSAGRILVVY